MIQVEEPQLKERVKIGRSEMVKNKKHMMNTRWLANPNQGRSTFLKIFWRSYEYLIQYQSEDFRAP
jgi:hypothetical protein